MCPFPPAIGQRQAVGQGLWQRHDGRHAAFRQQLALEAQQVIYAGGAISSGIKQAEIGKALAELDLQKNVQEIRFLLVGLI